MACFAGYTDDEKQHLPRKKKKLLKTYLKHVGCYVNNRFDGFEFSRCTIAEDYKKVQPLFKLIPYFKKNKKAINFILFVANENNECIIEIENGEILTLTSEHYVWLPILNCYRKVKDLKAEDEIYLLL